MLSIDLLLDCPQLNSSDSFSFIGLVDKLAKVTPDMSMAKTGPDPVGIITDAETISDHNRRFWQRKQRHHALLGRRMFPDFFFPSSRKQQRCLYAHLPSNAMRAAPAQRRKKAISTSRMGALRMEWLNMNSCAINSTRAV